MVTRPRRPCRNYLRVRGEYGGTCHGALHALGTTSACAENTTPLAEAGGVAGNYLRVRGEYRGTTCF